MGVPLARAKTWVSAEVLTAADLNAEFNNIINNLDPDSIDDASTNTAAMRLQQDPYPASTESLATDLRGEIERIRYQLAQITGNTYWYEDPAGNLSAAAPVGSIIPFYDFGTGGPGSSPLTFSSTYWAYCDGSTTTLNGAGSFTLPDLSNRYLVGFGTEGGGDMDSAAWNTAAVGNADHEVDLSHTHTGPSHTHTGPSHTHTGPSHIHTMGTHTHTDGSYHARAWVTTPARMHLDMTTVTSWNSDSSIQDFNTSSTTTTGITSGIVVEGVSGSTDPGDTNSGGTGNTGPEGTGNTGPGGTGATGSGGSATEDIQPRSIRVRFLMRIA